MFSQYLKWILFAVKFPFQQYIVCWGIIYGLNITGVRVGGGGAPSHLGLLFCKYVYLIQELSASSERYA